MVASRRKMMCPDCSPPRAKPVLVQSGQHVAVPHRGLLHGDAPLLHGPAEAEVGHHRDHHRVAGQLSPLGQVEGEQGQQLVPADHPALGVDGEQAVGVAVEGQPQMGLVLHHGAGQRVGGGGPAAGVDVGAVGLAADGDHLGAQSLVDAGGQRRGGAVGAVDHQPEAVEGPALDERAQVLDVGVTDRRARCARRRRRGPRVVGGPWPRDRGSVRARPRWPTPPRR